MKSFKLPTFLFVYLITYTPAHQFIDLQLMTKLHKHLIWVINLSD